MNDLIDWTDAFDNGGYVPGSAALGDTWAGLAADFRDRADGRLDLAYGDGARQRLDLFRPDGAARGCVVFVHGGYWHKFDKSFWSHLAAGPLAHGWAVAMPSYTLAPEARISRITREIGQAINFAAAEVDGPLRLIGHSAGGHLVSRAICADTTVNEDAKARIERVVSVSGVHDLRPLVFTGMNEILQLDAQEAAAESPALLEAAPVPTVFWTGADERPEFVRQARLIAEAWSRKGLPVTNVFDPGHNHFSVIEGLGDPQGALVQALLSD